jgi:hypothetical protein
MVNTIEPVPGETFVRKVEMLKVGETMHRESVLLPTHMQTTPFVDDPRGPREKPKRFHPVTFSQE